MGTFSIWHILVVAIVVVLLFGAGKIPRLMGDMAKGVKAFKEGLKGDEAETAKAEPVAPPAQVSPPATADVKKDTAKV